jgi:hypothetical protein
MRCLHPARLARVKHSRHPATAPTVRPRAVRRVLRPTVGVPVLLTSTGRRGKKLHPRTFKPSGPLRLPRLRAGLVAGRAPDQHAVIRADLRRRGQRAVLQRRRCQDVRRRAQRRRPRPLPRLGRAGEHLHRVHGLRRRDVLPPPPPPPCRKEAPRAARTTAPRTGTRFVF